MKGDYIQIQWTAESVFEARQIIKELLESRLIACGSIMPILESLYSWRGEIEQVREVKVWMKSHMKHYDKIEKKIIELHSYEIPELIVFKVLKASPGYSKWMDGVIGK